MNMFRYGIAVGVGAIMLELAFWLIVIQFVRKSRFNPFKKKPR